MKKLAIILSIFTAMFMLACNSDSTEAKVQVTPSEECKPDTVKIYDTVYIKPAPVKAKRIKRAGVKRQLITVDTLAIIENYKKSLKTQDSPSITVIDSTKYNLYISKKWSFTQIYVFPQIKKTEATRNFYAGFGTSINRNVFNSIYVGGLYKTKRDEILKLDVGFANDGNGQFYPFVGTGIYFKIK